MKQSKREYADDDGRVICDMDVDGMPNRFRRLAGKGTPTSGIARGDPLTRSEARRFTANALLAVLLIGAVFAGTWILFTLFLTQVLFR